MRLSNISICLLASALGRIDIYTLQLGFYLLKWKYVAKPL